MTAREKTSNLLMVAGIILMAIGIIAMAIQHHHKDPERTCGAWMLGENNVIYCAWWVNE